MREPSPRAPFDQGLFLTHFNKGKDLYDQKRFEEAERELEEAYLLRPRDQKVLNLLGLIYFKQDKFEKAEEVYRKLAAESPDAHTLFYNLGLIYFKLGRLEEAESAFVKALELARENPKINFYLGSIYERLHRFQDAIYQYRQAGANIMVRRVEDKIAASGPSGTPAPPARQDGTLPPVVRGDDTAKFQTRDLQEAIRRHAEEAALVPPKKIHPVSESLLAEGSPRKVIETDTARFRLPEALDVGPRLRTDATLPPATSPHRRADESFRYLENRLMEINFSGKVFIKQGTIYSYSGNLTFWVKERRPGGVPALVIITGNGKVILTDKDRDITFMQVMDETIFVEPLHLLACEESLAPRYVPLDERNPGPEFLALEGNGLVAFSVSSKPLALAVTPELPVSVPSSSVISWSGTLISRVVEDKQLYEVMLPPGSPPGSLIRLSGTGRILVEQPLS